MARFGEVVVAMVTPFDDDLALDLDAARDLARWLVEQGADGLVLAGTTAGPELEASAGHVVEHRGALGVAGGLVDRR